MVPYDSDSSEDAEDYTETDVLLGYASKEVSGDAISHLGGAPVGALPCLRNVTLNRVKGMARR